MQFKALVVEKDAGGKTAAEVGCSRSTTCPRAR